MSRRGLAPAASVRSRATATGCKERGPVPPPAQRLARPTRAWRWPCQSALGTSVPQAGASLPDVPAGPTLPTAHSLPPVVRTAGTGPASGRVVLGPLPQQQGLAGSQSIGGHARAPGRGHGAQTTGAASRKRPRPKGTRHPDRRASRRIAATCAAVPSPSPPPMPPWAPPQGRVVLGRRPQPQGLAAYGDNPGRTAALGSPLRAPSPWAPLAEIVRPLRWQAPGRAAAAPAHHRTAVCAIVRTPKPPGGMTPPWAPPVARRMRGGAP